MTHPETLTISRAVVEQALEALNEAERRMQSLYPPCVEVPAAIDAIRAALQAQASTTTNGPPERDHSKPAEQQGVFRKFNVQRTDGSDKPGGKHHGCEYFVLDVAHDQHAKPALEAYANACAITHPQLSADMRERYGLQPQAADQDPNSPWLSSAHMLCSDYGIPHGDITERINALRDKLAAAEPVAYMDADGNFSDNNDYGAFNIPLYTTQPATQAENPLLKDYVEKTVAAERRKWQAALTVALEALNSCTPGDYSTGHVIAPCFDEKLVDSAIAQIEALGVKHD